MCLPKVAGARRRRFWGSRSNTCPIRRAMRDPMDLTALGFDYGTHRIGVAAGQTVTGTASPLGIVLVLRKRPHRSSVSALIPRGQPNALVGGFACHIDCT